MIEFRSVDFSWKRTPLFQDLNVTLGAGATGLLGPNGSGKSTFLKLLLGLLRPSRGTITALGQPVPGKDLQWRQRLGYMPQSRGLLPGLNAVEYVSLCGRLSGMNARDALERSHAVLFELGLGEARYRPIDGFSTGMQQRVKLAQALVHDPPLVVVDEPTNGLDPAGREDMLRDLGALVAAGKTLILVSHLLDDVERVCSEALLMVDGKVTYQGLTSKESDVPRYQARLRSDPETLRAALAQRGISAQCLAGSRLTLELTPPHTLADVWEVAGQVHALVWELWPQHSRLEAIYAAHRGGEGS